jgi:CheY-like chemotaxis protein
MRFGKGVRKMNEPWIDISTKLGPMVATDRLGFRSVIGGPALKNGALRETDSSTATKSLVLVEDSDEDALLFNHAVRKSGKNVTVSRAATGKQARQLLSEVPPALIALDCHLQGESGLQILREIRSRDSYRRVPVVMMSGTESDADIQSAYAFGANSFLRKPFLCEEYVDSVKMLLEYWLEKNCTSLLPHPLPHGVWLG